MFILANYCDFMAKLSSGNTKRDSLQVTLETSLERGESGGSLVFCLRELKSYKHAQVHSGPERALADKSPLSIQYS